MALRFVNEHDSWASSPIRWKIEIHDSAHVGGSTTFEVAAGAEIQYRATGDSVFAPIIGSTLAFDMQIEDTTHEALITDMAGAAEGRFTIVLYKDGTMNWVGVVNSPEITIEDWDYPYSFRVTAVDGLALLKNYEYRQDGTSATKWSLRYTGIDSITDIILRCLQKLPHVVTHFTGSTKFLVTAINWYATEHDATAVASDYCPFYYTEIDNRFSVTGQSSGNAKFLSCFDVVSQILTTFNARIALFDGYFLAEQIEHRAYAIGSNDNYSRYVAYDGTGLTANTLTADQDIGDAQTIKKLRGGSYSFLSAAKSVRVKQQINSLANLLEGEYFDSGAVEEATVTNVFGDGVNTYLKLTGNLQYTYVNSGSVSTAGVKFIARFRIKLKLDTLYAVRTITYDAYGNYTNNGLSWDASLGYYEIPVVVPVPDALGTITGQVPIDFELTLDSTFTSGELVFSIEFIEVNYYFFGSEALLDPSEYELDWAFKDPYCAIFLNPADIHSKGVPSGAANPKNATYEVIGNDDNSETVEVATILGDRIGTIVNQWGGLLFNDAGTYSYTSQWGARNGTRNRTIAQLLAKRIIEFLYYPKRTYRGTAVGSALVIQVPITDQTTSETYILQSGVYYTHRDELAGEWVDISYATPELTYAPVEYDTEGYEKTTPSGGSSGGGAGSVDNGGSGAGAGGTADGNGIYTGSGIVPDATIAAMAGDFTFSNSAATAGEAFTVTIDDGSNSSTIRAQATDGILLQATGADDIEIEGITRLSDIIVSASLGSDQNDYAGFDGANTGRITSSTAINITGLASGSAGRILCLHNVGSNPVTLVNASASSSAANRFDIGEDYTVRSKHCAFLQYDGTDNRWRLVATDRLGRFAEAYTTSTATTASISADTPATNVGLAIVPKGTGAFLLSIPDGTSTGGNARGSRALDLQTDRNNAAQVASGTAAIVLGGRRNTASGSYSIAMGGASTASNSGAVAIGGNGSTGATASGSGAIAMGAGSTASGDNTFAIQASTASTENSIAFGGTSTANYGELSHTSFSFLHFHNATITGTTETEMFLNSGGTSRATISSGTYWQFEIVVTARVLVVGGGALTAGDCYSASYVGVIANKSGTTALIGTVDALMAAKSDASMSDVVFNITADNTNDSLKVTYTAGANSTGSTQTKVSASVKIKVF